MLGGSLSVSVEEPGSHTLPRSIIHRLGGMGGQCGTAILALPAQLPRSGSLGRALAGRHPPWLGAAPGVPPISPV